MESCLIQNYDTARPCQCHSIITHVVRKITCFFVSPGKFGFKYDLSVIVHVELRFGHLQCSDPSLYCGENTKYDLD